MITIVVVFFSLILNVKVYAKECYADNDKPYSYFSTKTAYEVSRAKNMNAYNNCTPVYLWALIRHGVRYNSKDQIIEMKKLFDLRNEITKNHQLQRGNLCEKDIENLEKWNFTLDQSYGSELTLRGKLDQAKLAERLKERFPKLLLHNRYAFDLQTSEAKRSIDSAVAFTNKLLNTNYSDEKELNITINQTLLHLNKNCPKYSLSLEENKKSLMEELEEFEKSSVMNRLIMDVSNRLGFTSPLQYDDVNLMYQSCAFENAWYPNITAPFCAAFIEEELKILEYADDLEEYWVKGYGNPLQMMLSCPLLKSILDNLNYASVNSIEQTASFYFSHSESILPLMVSLGLNDDGVELLHDNYEEMKNNRKWRLALVDGFNANLIFFLQRCKGEDYVVLYQNENEVTIPGCKQSPCPLKYFQQKLENLLSEGKCENFETNCNDIHDLPNSAYSKEILFLLNWNLGLSFLISFIKFM